MRKKRLVAFVGRSLAPPDLNVEPVWLKWGGPEVRNKRLVYVGAFVVPKRRFNIEIGGRGGSSTARKIGLGVFFAHTGIIPVLG